MSGRLKRLDAHGIRRRSLVSPRPCVVVADDNEDLRYLVMHTLEPLATAKGFDVDEAADGGPALEAVERRIAEGRRVLLVSDNRMPGMSGPELIRRARARHSPDALRVTVLTSAEPPGELRRELEALHVRIYPRPPTLHELRMVLRECVDSWLDT